MNKKKILRIIFILIILVSGAYFAYDYFKPVELPEALKESKSAIDVKDSDKKEYKLEDGSIFKLSPDVDLNQKRKEHNNNEIIGRLEVPGMFNVLVVKGKNNTFYLDHDVNKKYEIKGTEFLDYRLNVNSNQINIYGHNTRDPRIKVPFQKLTKFLEKKYFDENPYIVFQTDYGREYYKIINIKEVTTDKEHMLINYSGQEFVKHINKLLSNSIQKRNVYYDENSKIMVLQTCSYTYDNAFYIITAIKLTT